MNETVDFKLPVSGKDVLLRGYMTGFIDQEIERARGAASKTVYDIDASAINAAKASGEDPTPSVHVESDPAEAAIRANNKRVELMVTALEGQTGDILDRVLALPKQDVKFILEKIAEVEGESKVEATDPKAPAI